MRARAGIGLKNMTLTAITHQINIYRVGFDCKQITLCMRT